MQRKLWRSGALLASAAVLGGCSWVNPALTSAADAGFGAPFLLPWSNTRDVRLADSYTVRRLGGAEGVPVEERLQVEPGNVWPAEETPRATLANPDAALRGVPAWRPNEGRSARDLPIDERSGGPLVPPRADASPAERGPPPRRRGPGSQEPQPLAQPRTDPVRVPPAPPGDIAPPAPRTEGQVVLTPGGPVVTGAGTGRVQTFTTPGGGGGTIHRDGGFTTIVPSGGVPQTFPTPR